MHGAAFLVTARVLKTGAVARAKIYFNWLLFLSGRSDGWTI